MTALGPRANFESGWYIFRPPFGTLLLRPLHPCSKSFDVSFKDTKNTGTDLYYWPEFDTPYGTYKGRLVKRYNGGGTISMKATALYPGFSYGDSCELLIGSSHTPSKNATRGHGQYQGYVYIPDFDPDCFRYCCSDSNVSDGWYHVTGKRYGTDLIGVKGQLKSMYGDLCGEDCNSTEYTHQATYVDISKEMPSDTQWIQTGYIQMRPVGQSDMIYGLYAEVSMDDYYKDQYVSDTRLPFEGSWHSYRCEVQKDEKDFEFFYDDENWIGYDDWAIPWSSSAGNSAQVSAEVYCLETRMSGVWPNYPCSTNICMYWEYGSNYVFFNFYDPDVLVGTSDANNWWVEAWAQDGLRFGDKR